MADPIAPNTGLLLPSRGAYLNTWDVPVNANFTAIDAMLGGTTTVGLSNANVALTQTQAQASSIYFTGAISANIVVSLPAGFGGIFSVLNGTIGTSGQTVVLQTANNGTAIILPAGLRVLAISDGTNVYLADQSLPPGTPISWLSNVIPGGFIPSYGQVLSQASQPGIYAVYGTVFNTGGEGAGNFRMPDLRGVTFAGLDNMGGSARGLLTAFGSSGQQLGAVGGEQSHTLATTELPAHAHGVNDAGHTHPVTDPGHAHPYTRNNPNNVSLSVGGAGNNGSIGEETNTTIAASTGVGVGAATTGISIQNAGGGGAHNNVQPTMLCNWIVKT